MLKCKDIVEQASDYIDADLKQKPDTPLWKIRLHLMICHHCRRFIKHLRATSKVAANMAENTDPIVVDEILYKIKNTTKKP